MACELGGTGPDLGPFRRQDPNGVLLGLKDNVCVTQATLNRRAAEGDLV